MKKNKNMTVLFSFLFLFALSKPSYSMDKFLKGVLIGLGSGFVVGATLAFISTYDFERGKFTTDPMPLS
ncbi:MAG: hypothetical protein ACE5FF_18345, partial [Saprospiraceae bacterium]